MKAQGLNKLNKLLETVNSRNQELLLQISSQKDVYKSVKNSNQKPLEEIRSIDKRFTSLTAKNDQQMAIQQMASDKFARTQVLHFSPGVEGMQRIKQFPVRSQSSNKKVVESMNRPQEIDAFLMQSEDTMQLQMQMKNLQQQLLLKDQLVTDLSKKNHTLSEDINFLNMSYKELKQATDENNSKLNATRKHLRDILQILQHKDKELKRLREKLRTNSNEDTDINKEEEKSNDKKILEYALYMEKQYKLLEDKLKKRQKLILELKGGDAKQLNMLIQENSEEQVGLKYEKSKQQIRILLKEKEQFLHQLSELDKQVKHDEYKYTTQIEGVRDDLQGKMQQSEQLHDEETVLKDQMIEQLKSQIVQLALSKSSLQGRDPQSFVKLEEKAKMLEKQNDKMQQKMRESMNQLSAQEQELIMARQQGKKDQEVELKKLKDEINQEILGLKKQNIDDLKKQQKQFASEKQDLLKQLQVLNNLNRQQQLDLQKQIGEFDALQQSMNELKVQYNVLASQHQSERESDRKLLMEARAFNSQKNEIQSSDDQSDLKVKLLQLTQHNEAITSSLKEQIQLNFQLNLDNRNLELLSIADINAPETVNQESLNEIIARQESQLDQLQAYNEEMIQLLDARSAEYDHLKLQHEQLVKDYVEKCNLNGLLQQDFIEKNDTIFLLQQQIQDIQKEQSAYQKAYSELEDEITNIQSENLNQVMEYQQQLKNQEENLDLAHNEIIMQQEQREKSDKSAQALRSATQLNQNQLLRTFIKQYKSQSVTLKNNLSALAMECSHVKDESELALRTLQEELSSKINRMCLQLEQEMGVQNYDRKDFQRLQYCITACVGQIQSLRGEQQNQTELLTSREESSRREVKLLQNGIAELKNANTDLRDDLEREGKMKAGAVERMTQVAAELEQLKYVIGVFRGGALWEREQEVQSASRKASQRQTVVVELEQQVSELSGTLKVSDQERLHMKQELVMVQQIKDNQQQELVELKNRNANLESALHDLKDQNKMMINDSDKSVKERYAKMELVQKQLLAEKTVNDQLTEKLELKCEEYKSKDEQVKDYQAQLDKARKQLLALQHNLKELQDQLSEQTQVTCEKDLTITKQVDNVTKLQRQLTQLQDEYTLHQQDCFQRVQRLKHEQTQLEALLEQQKSDNVEQAIKVARQEQEITTLRQSNEEVEAQVFSTTQLNEQLKLQIKKRDTEIKNIQEDKFRQEKESVILLNTVSEQHTKSQGQLCAQIKKLQQDLKVSQGETEQLQQQLDELTKKHKEALVALQQLTKNEAELQRTTHQQEIERQHTTHQQEIERQRTTHQEEIERQRTTNQEEIERLRTTHQDLMKQVESDKMKLVSEHLQALLKKEQEIVALTRLREENELHYQELIKDKDHKIQESNERQRLLNNDLNQKESSLREAISLNKYQENDLSSMKKDLAQRDHQNQELKLEVAKIAQQLQHDQATHQQTCEFLQSQIKELQNTNRNLSDARVTLEKSLTQKDDILQGIKENQGGAERDKLDLQMQLDQLLTVKAQLLDQLIQLTEKYEHDVKERDTQTLALKTQHAQTVKDAKDTQQQQSEQISKLTDLNNTSAKVRSNLEIEIADLKGQLREQGRKASTAQEEVFSHNDRVIAMETQLEQRGALINNLTNDIKNWELSAEQLRRQLKDSQKDAADKDQELVALLTQLTQVQRSCEARIVGSEGRADLRLEEVESTHERTIKKMQSDFDSMRTQLTDELQSQKKQLVATTNSAQESIKNLIEKNDTNLEQLEELRLQLQDLNQHNLHLKSQLQQNKSQSQNIDPTNNADDKNPFCASDVSSIDKEEMIGFMGKSFESHEEENIAQQSQSIKSQNPMQQQQSLNHQIPFETRSLNEHQLQNTIKQLKDENDNLKKQNMSFYSHQVQNYPVSERQDSIIQELKNESEFLKYKVTQMEEVQSDMQQQEQKYVAMVRQLKQDKNRVETEMQQTDFSHQKRQIKQLLNSFIQSLSTNAKETEEYLGIVLNIVEFTENEKEALQKIIREVIKDRKKPASKGGFFNKLL